MDLTDDQWTAVIDAVISSGLIPFVDIAYQGFGDGIDADGKVVRRFTEAGGPVFVSNSFSKSFSLYGERVGALSVVASSSEEAARVLSQLKRTVRTNYSNPPTHGGQIVATVLANPELRATVGAGTRPDARAHPRNAQTTRGEIARPHAGRRISISSRASAACFPTPACRRTP